MLQHRARATLEVCEELQEPAATRHAWPPVDGFEHVTGRRRPALEHVGEHANRRHRLGRPHREVQRRLSDPQSRRSAQPIGPVLQSGGPDEAVTRRTGDGSPVVDAHLDGQMVAGMPPGALQRGPDRRVPAQGSADHVQVVVDGARVQDACDGALLPGRLPGVVDEDARQHPHQASLAQQTLQVVRPRSTRRQLGTRDDPVLVGQQLVDTITVHASSVAEDRAVRWDREAACGQA